MVNIYEYKIAHPGEFKQLSVRDLLFVYYKCPQIERQIQLHTHYNLIWFTLEGSRIFHQAEKRYVADKKSAFFVRKTGYVQVFPECLNWKVLAFYIPDDFLKQVVNEYSDILRTEEALPVTEEVFIKINLDETTRTYFYGMIPYFTKPIPPKESLLELKFKELLINVLSIPSNKELLSYILHLSDNYKTPIWHVMEKNYMYNLTISELARISGRSLTSFKKEFSEYYQTTPGKWLTMKRLEHARTLLNTTKLSISDIVFNSGFENVSHFSRVFKERFGSSPLQYRKSQMVVV